MPAPTVSTDLRLYKDSNMVTFLDGSNFIGSFPPGDIYVRYSPQNDSLIQFFDKATNEVFAQAQDFNALRDDMGNPWGGTLTDALTAINAFLVCPCVTGGCGGNTIYSADDTLTGDRTVSGGNFDLTFSGIDAFLVSANSITLSGGFARSVADQAINYTILNTDFAIKATAAITLTMPASPTVGQEHKIYANGFVVVINPNAGQTIIGRPTVSIRRQQAIILQYTSSNNWLIS